MNTNLPTQKPALIQFFENISLPVKLLFDGEVPLKAKIIPSLIFFIYLISPTDIIIDYLPVLGLVDDTAVLTLCAYLIVKMTPPEILKKYAQTDNKKLHSKEKDKIIDIDPQDNNNLKKKI